jgi:putative FmdB family regulatory protein
MPIYDYRCDKCGKVYDIFHKVREELSDVLCPTCGAIEHTRLISAPSVNTGGKSSGMTFGSDDVPPCANGGSCPGSCGLN